VIVNVLAGALHRAPLWRSLARWFSRTELDAGFEALRRVGIVEQAVQRASTLSGGQQQRAAIARALVQRAKVVLADEPIASLDPESSRKVMEILATINREDGCTVLVSLHQVNVAMKYCPRTVALHRGKVVYDGPSAALTPALLRSLYGAEADEILSLPDHISVLQGVSHAARPSPVLQENTAAAAG
jgi:phosphonate transport system ATP-binding protein